jgi:hypothetical protein
VQLAPELRNDRGKCALLQSIKTLRGRLDAIEKVSVEVAVPELLAKGAKGGTRSPIEPTQALVFTLGVSTEGNARPGTSCLRH